MEFMTWTSDLSVGVAVLDDDHKKLIGIFNQLHFGITAGHDKKILEIVLGELLDYIKFHFGREESMLIKAGYVATASHMADHEKFIGEILSVQARIKTSPVVLLDLELMGFLRDWLFTHIRVTDKKYEPDLNAAGFH
jgi:hemerythrin-like metal-binding protein